MGGRIHAPKRGARGAARGLDRYGLKQWITAAKRRLHPNVLAIALANKLARIAWAVLSKDCDFKSEKTDETPRCAYLARSLSLNVRIRFSTFWPP
jgi:hypothetical protein